MILSKLFSQHDFLVARTKLGFKPDLLLPYSISTFVAGALAGCFSREKAFEYAEKRADFVRKAEADKPETERAAMAIVVGDGSYAGNIAKEFGLNWTNDNFSVHVLGGKKQDLQEMINKAGVRFRGYLTAEAEYHTHARDEESEKFADYLSDEKFDDPGINIISSTNPRLLKTGEAVKEELWQLMTTKIVLKDILDMAAKFTSGKKDACLDDLSNNIFIDISPENTMKKMLARFPGLTVIDLGDKRLNMIKY